MRQRARTTRGDEGDAHRVGRRAHQLQVIAGAGAVAVHRGEQDLPRAARLQLPHPGDRLERRLFPATVHHDGIPAVCPPRVHRGDDALAAEALREPGDQRGITDGGGVDRHLVGAGAKGGAGVGHGADASADGERDEDRVGDPRHHLEGGAALVGAGGDVEEDQLVGAVRVVARGLLDRIAGVAQGLEVHALHDPASSNVETGDDAPG
jgi:hypothetical protein